MTPTLPSPVAPDKPLCLMAEGLAGLWEPADAPAVLVEGGEIKALGQRAMDAGADRLPLPGLWLAPAPLDAHVHLHLGGTVAKNLEATLRAGVAAVRDLGHAPRVDTPRTPGAGPPWVVASGPGLGTRGEGASWLAEPLGGPEQFRAAAEARAQALAGVIKVFATGLLDFERPGRVLHPDAVGLEEMAAAVEAAEKAGLAVAVHANGVEAVARALEAGARSVEHGYFVDRATLADMAARRVSWAPTCAAVEAHVLDPEGRHTPAELDGLKQILAGQLAALRLAEALGVDLVLGTDAGSYGLEHGAAVFKEMACWLGAGVRPLTVFHAATRRAARLMGLEGRLGVLAPGARAWLVAVPGNPEVDPLLLGRARWRSF